MWFSLSHRLKQERQTKNTEKRPLTTDAESALSPHARVRETVVKASVPGTPVDGMKVRACVWTK